MSGTFEERAQERARLCEEGRKRAAKDGVIYYVYWSNALSHYVLTAGEPPFWATSVWSVSPSGEVKP